MVDAARCLKIGTVQLSAGHGVDAEDYQVDFKAGESIEFGPGWKGGTNWSAQIGGPSCSNLCTSCCTYTSQLTYDPPVDPYELSPNNDGNNDIFFVSDLANPYSAYNATRWHFRVWKKNIFNWYHEGNKIWFQTSFGQIDHPFDICAGWETPTEQHPYKTFWWDATEGLGNNIGDPVSDGTYVYEIDFDGCQLNSSGINDPTGHSLTYMGEIEVVGSPKAPINTDNNELIDQIAADMNQHYTGEPLVNIFPNPTTNSVFITLIGTTFNETHFELFDMSGKKVLDNYSSNMRSEINLGHLSRGLYQLKITNAENEFYEKIVLQ